MSGRLPLEGALDADTPGGIESVLLRVLLGDLLDPDAEPAPVDLALLEEPGEEALDQVRWNGEPDGAVPRGHRVHADHLPRHVDERPAGVPRVHGGVRLDEVEARRGDEEGRALAAHDPEGHRLLEAEGVTEGEDELADPEALRVPEGEDRQPLSRVDLDQGEIHPGVPSEHRPREPSPRREPDLDGQGILDDVGVGDEVAIRVDQEARAERRTAPPLLGRRPFGPPDPDLDEPGPEALGQPRQRRVEPAELGIHPGRLRVLPEPARRSRRRLRRQGAGRPDQPEPEEETAEPAPRRHRHPVSPSRGPGLRSIGRAPEPGGPAPAGSAAPWRAGRRPGSRAGRR